MEQLGAFIASTLGVVGISVIGLALVAMAIIAFFMPIFVLQLKNYAQDRNEKLTTIIKLLVKMNPPVVGMKKEK